MRKLFLFFTFTAILFITGLVLGQTTAPAFELVQELGQPRPRGIAYEANFDQIAWVSPRGQLQLVDATTFTVQHTLYETGFYNAYEFSHNGVYLAVAIDTRFDIWDSQSGELLTTFEPDGALRAEGRLYWSLDDTLLSVNTQVRAPQAIRQSENDTSNLPYIWDVASALGERRTILPGARAIPFFDYRNGFVYGTNNTAIVGLPERLQILGISADAVDVVGEIEANRFERDPIFVWQSLHDDLMYIRPDNRASNLVQLDTTTANMVDIPIGREINTYTIDTIADLQFSRTSQIIGQPLDTQENSLLRTLLGDNYRAQFAYHPITVTLIDYLQPMTNDAGNQTAILLYIFDETRGVGRFDFISSYQGTGFSVSEDRNTLAIRRNNSEARIDIYDIDSGRLLQTFTPAMPEIASGGIFAFDNRGETIISDFQRFDVQSGAVLHENLHYNNGFEQFYWNDTSDQLVTVSGSRWWVWDIFTGEIIRREQLNLGQNVVRSTDNGERYLISVAEEANTLELVDIGMEDIRRITFQDLPNVSINDVIFSPNNENYLVVYSVNSLGQHAPSNEIMLYNLEAGALWHIAGDDLPPMANRQYGWVDDDTVYIYAEEGQAAPERVYGVDYHSSGVPQCLADAYPEQVLLWSAVWERLNQNLRTDDLHNLSQATCDLLPAEDGEEAVIELLFPTATPTRLPVTATPSTIAGVPLCLTNRFPNEARDYAVIWQELTAGLSDLEIEELELLLCENLRGNSGTDGSGTLITDNVYVMTIDIHTGIREIGSFIPEQIYEERPNIELVNQAFRQQFGRSLNGQLSPDRRYFATQNNQNQISIYRLLTPYESYATNATATVAIVDAQEEDEVFLSLRPTATQGFQYLGEARPTLTPTVTPTSPPPPSNEPYLAQDTVVEMVCPFDEIFTLDNPPADFAASGRILTSRNNDIQAISSVQGRWVFDLATGAWTLDDALPDCYADGDCRFTFDKEWMYFITDAPELVVARPDGTQARTLFYENQLPFEVARDFRWFGHTLQYEVRTYVDESRAPQNFLQRYNADDGSYSDLIRFAPLPDYNQLRTSVISTQPSLDRRYTVMQVPFTTSSGEGSRYFLYDRADEAFTLFARLSDIQLNGGLQLAWHPLGDYFTYNLPDDPTTYAFIADTETFAIYGEPSIGTWSPDAQRTVRSVGLLPDEREALIENESPVPHIEIWNSQTGLRQQYCLPQFEEVGLETSYYWSPDGDYIAFRATLPTDRDFTAPPIRTYILDTSTGSVTEISDVIGPIAIWIRERY